MGKKGDRGARVWRVGTGTGVCGEGWGEEGDGTEADRRGRQKEEEELGVGLWVLGHLGLGQTQMSGGFTVFSNDGGPVWFLRSWVGRNRNGKASKGAGVCWQGKERRGLGGAGVRECGCGCCGVWEFVGAQRSKEGKTRIRSPRVWGSGSDKGWVGLGGSVWRRVGVVG